MAKHRTIDGVRKDNHNYCFACKSQVGELYHCDACIRSFHPHCSHILRSTLAEGDTKLTNVQSPWKCDVCLSTRQSIRFHDEDPVVVEAGASSTTLIELLLKNMKHDATNRQVRSIHGSFVAYYRNKAHRTRARASPKPRGAREPRVTMSPFAPAQPNDDTADPTTDWPEPTDEANDEAIDDDDDPNARISRHVQSIADILMPCGQSSDDDDEPDDDDDDDDDERPSSTPGTNDNVLRCMEWGCTTRTKAAHSSHANSTGSRWLCTSCRRVGVRIEIDLPLTPRFATILRVHRTGHVADLRFDNGRVESCCLDKHKWRVIELSFDRRFINISSLFASDPQSPRVEHTHQDDWIHFCAILQHLAGHAPSDHRDVRAPSVAPERLAIGLNNHVRRPRDERVPWPEYLDSHGVMCGIAFNSMKGSYTSGRQLPLYQYARLFDGRRLCIWRTVARIADSAPVTSFEKEFARHIVPVYDIRYPKTRMGITRQRFEIQDRTKRAVLEWTYLIRHDPTVRCTEEDPIANSRVMMHNKDSCNVMVERLALCGVVFWDYRSETRAGRSHVRGSGSDKSLGVYVRYLWANFAKATYMTHLDEHLTRLAALLRGKVRGARTLASLMLFVVLLIKSLGDLGSACTMRALNDRMDDSLASLHRPPLFYNFVWTYDKHVSSLCAIITNGYVLFTPSVPTDNGLSIHGTFFENRRWLDAICAAYKLDAPRDSPTMAVGQVVVRMLFYVSEHLRRGISFTACQSWLRVCWMDEDASSGTRGGY